MHLKDKAKILLSAALLFFSQSLCLAEEPFPFEAEVSGNSINIRADSTVNSPVLGALNKGQHLSVAYGHYDWYKVILPKDIPVFIREDFVILLDSKSAKVIKDRVNIRIGPADSSAVIGMAKKDDNLNILAREKGWYKIEPLDSCFGWVHKQFIRKATPKPKATEEAVKAGTSENNIITVEGIINPYGMVLRRVATHKIITRDNKIYLLKGNKKNLNAVIYRKAKITGKLMPQAAKRYPVIEVIQLELVD